MQILIRWINFQGKIAGAGAKVNLSVQESGSRDILLPTYLFLKPALLETVVQALAHNSR